MELVRTWNEAILPGVAVDVKESRQECRSYAGGWWRSRREGVAAGMVAAGMPLLLGVMGVTAGKGEGAGKTGPLGDADGVKD